MSGRSALVVGATRGIGLALVKNLREDGWAVTATYRQPADAARLTALGATAVQLEVTDAAGAEALAAALGEHSLDLAIINAGVLPPGDSDIAHPDEAAFLDGMRINVLAPLRLAGLLRSRMKRAGTVGFLSSQMGSISRTDSGDRVFYRASKAALNMVVKTLALNWQSEQLRAIALHPGWVQTDMGGAHAAIDPATSASGLLTVLAVPGMDRSGRFFDYAGNEFDW